MISSGSATASTRTTAIASTSTTTTSAATKAATAATPAGATSPTFALENDADITDWLAARVKLLESCTIVRKGWLEALRDGIVLSTATAENKDNHTSIVMAAVLACRGIADVLGETRAFVPGPSVVENYLNDWPLAAALQCVFGGMLSSKVEPIILKALADALAVPNEYFGEERMKHVRKMMWCAQMHKFEQVILCLLLVCWITSLYFCVHLDGRQCAAVIDRVQATDV